MSSMPPKTSDPSASGNDETLFTEALNAACKEWQVRLGLQDWIVEVRVGRAKDLDPDCRAFATNVHSITEKFSNIKVVDPVDLPILEDSLPKGEAQDYDLHLVHELIHLHFAPFQVADTDPQHPYQEQAINMLSRSIIRAYRSTGQPSTPTLAVQHGHYIIWVLLCIPFLQNLINIT